MPDPPASKSRPHPWKIKREAPARPELSVVRPHPPYAELQVTTNFTFLTGASHPDEIVTQAGALDYHAVAVTDTSNLFGAPEFSKAAATAGIQPIIGCQLSVAREDDEGRPGNGARFGSRLRPDKLVLLGKGQVAGVIDRAGQSH